MVTRPCFLEENTIMVSTTFMRHTLLVTSLMLTASAALAQEPALAFSAQAPNLQWKSCPDPLPKGCQLAVLHGDPAKPNADVFLKLPGPSKIPLHTHTSAERIVLVAGTFHITYEGQKMAVLQPGSYAYGPATKPHSAECVSRKPCILFIAFEAPVDIKLVANAAK
jgi:anti-sigma factor ChrR (cupin superfamily)